MHPPPIIIHHHQRWCLRHHIFFYCKPEASYITYPSYTKLSYTALFWNSLYMICLTPVAETLWPRPQHLVAKMDRLLDMKDREVGAESQAEPSSLGGGGAWLEGMYSRKP